MREIIFRGKGKYTGSWYYGSLLNPTQGYHFPQIWDWELDVPFPVLEETVGQFTGRLDKDDKLIYEGDRLMCTVNDEPIGEIDRVQFKDGEFRLANRDRSLRSWLYIEELYGKEVECNFYLAGNIFEHPDLLK